MFYIVHGSTRPSLIEIAFGMIQYTCCSQAFKFNITFSDEMPSILPRYRVLVWYIEGNILPIGSLLNKKEGYKALFGYQNTTVQISKTYDGICSFNNSLTYS